MNNKKIIFTGGGSGGHVVSALSIIEALQEKDPTFEVSYIGSYGGIEKEIITKKQIPYRQIHTGKLRRYISIKNLIDFFKFIIGIFNAFFILWKFPKKDTILFSTGGFVSVPPVIAAWMVGVPVLVHEQTSRIGLANKISSYFAKKIFVSFKESQLFFPKEKTFFSGYPVRKAIFLPVKERITVSNTKIYPTDKPILLLTGGGNGSLLLNNLIKNCLTELSKNYLIIHQVGQDHLSNFEHLKSETYIPVPFLGDEIIELFKVADVIISRSGAGTVSELIAAKKRSIYIPLKIAQKNEQFHNAKVAEKQLGSLIISEDELEGLTIFDLIDKFNQDSNNSIKVTDQPDSYKIILEELLKSFNN